MKLIINLVFLKKEEKTFLQILNKRSETLIVFVLMISLLILFSCKNNKTDINDQNKFSGLNDQNKFYNYITIDNKVFKDGDKDFYPLGINYAIYTWQKDSMGKQIVFVTPKSNYHPNFGIGEGESLSPWGFDSSKTSQIIRSHFRLIKDMGFNTIRLTGFVLTDEHGGFGTWSWIDLSNSPAGNKNIEEKIIPLLKMLLSFAEECGLRVILLIGPIENQPDNQLNLYSRLASGLSKEKALIAYDLFNEPIFFDLGDYTKKQTTGFIKSYNKVIKKNAPNQLTTIGLSHYKIAYEWDPELLDVDFIAFHVYPYGSKNLNKLERFDSKLYWISKTITKPWIIGETGLNTAENCEPINLSCGTYDDQLYFMSYSLEKVKDYGGSGYMWWSFQDTKNNPGEIYGTCEISNYGIINRKVNKYCINSMGDTILGELKHKLSELPFKNFLNNNPYNNDNCKRFLMPNPNVYYNIDYAPTQKKVYGRIIDENGNPVENAIISLNNTISKTTYTTFTKPDGSFELATGWTNVFNYLDFKIKVAAVKMITKEIPLKDLNRINDTTLENIRIDTFK